MNSFPSKPDKIHPHDVDMPMVDDIYRYLGCKEPLSRNFITACLTAVRVFDFKQGAYGSNNIAKKGVAGISVRVNDKIERLSNLLDRGENPAEESIEDTLGDIGVYGLIGLLVRWGMWPAYEKKEAIIQKPN